MARLLAALVALVAWAGLFIQYRTTLGSGYAPAETLWIMLRFFTVLTNLLLAVTMTAVALGARVAPFLVGGVTLAMALVGMVYLTLLRGLLDLSGGALLADTLLHKVTPVVVALWWLAFASKGRLTWSAPLGWALYPLLYFIYALARGVTDGRYAYPFIDIAKLGAATVALNAALIAASFLIAGLGLVALDRSLGGRTTRSSASGE